jgi:hypothetical protein
MSSYFPPLNLSLDADERAVKRAYAAALKETRPDDDPLAFQALVAARDRALDWVRRRGTGTLIPVLEEVAERPGQRDVAPIGETAPSLVSDTSPDQSDQATEAGFVKQGAVTVLPTDAPLDLPAALEAQLARSPSEGFATMVRSIETSRQVLRTMAIGLIREEAEGPGERLAERWDALLQAADELDLSGRMALERAIAVELDATMQGVAASDGFAATVLRLDRSFRWSDDPRRIARILGEPSGTHPLVFAIERFGVGAVRLRLSETGFPIIPASDLAAWFGSPDQAGAKAYRRAAKAGRFSFGWSWYAFLSPPAWCVRMGQSLWGIGCGLAAVTAIYVLFDPIGNVGNANAFASFLAVLIAFRIAAAVSARNLEIAALVRVIRRIEVATLPTLSERRRLIATAHGSKLLNVVVGLFFLLLVDGYCLSLVIPAMSLPNALVAQMIVIPDRKTPGVTFADRLVAQSYLDHAREIAEEIDDLVKAEHTADPQNPLRRRRVEALQQTFLDYIKVLPIPDYAADFDRFRSDVARLKRRS